MRRCAIEDVDPSLVIRMTSLGFIDANLIDNLNFNIQDVEADLEEGTALIAFAAYAAT